MSRIAIVYHSGFGHTKVQAEAVRDGAAQVRDADVHLIAVDALAIGDSGVESREWQHLDEADAIVFGSPTYMAGPSAEFKALMDATSGRWAGQAWRNKLAAWFTNSAGYNGDKLNTLEAFTLFAMQHSMVWIGLGLMPGNTTAEGSPEDLNRLAGFLGAMAQSNADVGPDLAPAGSDLRTAAHLGRRVAEAASRWNAQKLVSTGTSAGGAS